MLKKHHVPSVLYEKWLVDERFTRQFEQRIAGGYRQSRIILARKAPEAAKKLAELSQKGEGETTRKACLDIISQQQPAGRKAPSNVAPTPEAPAPAADLSPETASRFLAALAGPA